MSKNPGWILSNRLKNGLIPPRETRSKQALSTQDASRNREPLDPTFLLTAALVGILTGAVAFPTPSFGQAAPKMTDSQAREMGDAFEALMLQRVYEGMENSQRILEAGDDNPFAPSNAERIYRSMLSEAMQKDVAKRRPLGVGRLVERQLKGEGGIGSRALVESRNDLPRGEISTGPEKTGLHQEGEQHGRDEDSQ